MSSYDATGTVRSKSDEQRRTGRIARPVLPDRNDHRTDAGSRDGNVEHAAVQVLPVHNRDGVTEQRAPGLSAHCDIQREPRPA